MMRQRAFNLDTVMPSIRRMAADRDGGVMIVFAFAIIPVLFLTGMAVDYGRASNAQARLQSAADAAALATMNAQFTTEADRISIAQQVFEKNIASDSYLVGTQPTIDASAPGTTQVTAHAEIPTAFLKLAQVPTIGVNATASASTSASSAKLEVAVMIDVTGSMGQTRNGETKIASLKTASADLLDILFPNGATTSTTTRVGIVPMADFVNAGPYAAAATGLSSTGSYAKGSNLGSTKSGSYGNLNYSGASGGGNGHGFNANSSGGTYSSTYCTGSSQYQTVQGYTVGTPADQGAGGASQGQYAKYWKTEHHTKYYTLQYGYYTPVYASSCTPAADQSGQLITCVTERTGSGAYTDALPASGSYVGAYNQGRTSSVVNYSSDGKCYTAGRELPQIIPMTNDRSTLEDFFDTATIGGGTPGHLGHAWAYYMLSPAWSSVWPTASQPVAYGTANVTKAAVIMTDGEYNEQYSSASSRDQAQALCTAMKAKGIKVYTIGFGFSASPSAGSSEANAKDMLTQCSSGSNHYFFPYDGAALRQAFQTIGQSLTNTGPNQVKMTH